jgi:ABC-type glutathione transport system ATPase component
MDLIVRNLTKTFKSTTEEVRAIRGISFTIPSGLFFTLLGPSGCGKTTTLPALRALNFPTMERSNWGTTCFSPRKIAPLSCPKNGASVWSSNPTQYGPI